MPLAKTDRSFQKYLREHDARIRQRIGDSMQEPLAKPDIVAVLASEGVELKPKGSYLWGRCPLHRDKNPSFRVDPKRQTFKCFGCGARGDGIDFVMQKRKVPFLEALRILGIYAGRRGRPDPHEIETRRLVMALRLWCRDREIILARELRGLRRLVAGIETQDDLEKRAWAYDRIPVIEYQLDALLRGDDEVRYRLYCEALANG